MSPRERLVTQPTTTAALTVTGVPSMGGVMRKLRIDCTAPPPPLPPLPPAPPVPAPPPPLSSRQPVTSRVAPIISWQNRLTKRVPTKVVRGIEAPPISRHPHEGREEPRIPRIGPPK